MTAACCRLVAASCIIAGPFLRVAGDFPEPAQMAVKPDPSIKPIHLDLRIRRPAPQGLSDAASAAISRPCELPDIAGPESAHADLRPIYFGLSVDSSTGVAPIKIL